MRIQSEKDIAGDAGAIHRLTYVSGVRLFLSRIKYVLRYSLQPKKFPLFILRSSKGGVLRTQKIERLIRPGKEVRFRGHYYFTPNLPRRPSPVFDQMAAQGGLNATAAGTPVKRRIDVAVLGITRRCDLHCKHCYERFNIGDRDAVPIRRWKEIISQLQGLGTNIIALSGGEPMLRFDGVLELLECGDRRRSDFHVHTSGQGVTRERAEMLERAGLAAAAVGLDDVDPERHDSLRGYRGAFDGAVQALEHFRRAGIFTYVNMCVTRDIVRLNDLERYFDLTKRLGVGFIEMLEPRPCGGFLKTQDEMLLTPADRERLVAFYRAGSTMRKYRNHPILFYLPYIEHADRMGCLMGGLSHLHIDSLGNVNPCALLPVTFGNIMEEDFPVIYERMRKAIPRPLHRECPSITLGTVIRARSDDGRLSPVPFESVAQEWAALYS